MQVAIRLLRAFAAPVVVFAAVTALSWFLATHWFGSREPEVCPPGATAETPSQETPPATVSRVGYQAAVNGSGFTQSHVGTDVRYASSRAEGVRTSSNTLLGEREGASEELATLLDGHKGPRPANLMNCSSDGGTFRCGECTTDSECPAGQGCIINFGKGTFECAASECENDSGCFPGSVCRVAAGGAPGPVIRRCLLAGVRLAGESCSRWPATREEACGEGLLCINHRCGPPCTPGEPEACPEGYSCEESPSGAACVSDCRGQGCPTGKQCAALNGGVHQCLNLVVDECSDEKPCAQGENCIVRGRVGHAGRFCAAACDSWKTDSCSGAQVCGMGGPTGSACYAKCDPQDLSTCPQGWLCTTVTEDLQTWGCLPDFTSSVPAPPRPRPSAVRPAP
ncbi:hypothetical protein [Pyxidicoccus sp. MSG2]|uniref:hypothetical protein n=1 Tax=Pyxidicoccus sp. MSG2 TaxID=2996790 RepID=UPI00226E0875|nr:hypothetical protein [Pyxidicoccus sp. MSG2]MCY1017571.1 hypothetical protein [Pyxidicoccus sp. MSG2]